MRTLIIVTVLGGIILSIALAVNYPVRMLIDPEGHKLDINSNGSLSIKADGTGSAPTVTYSYPQRIILDQDGHKLDINSDGSINLKGS